MIWVHQHLSALSQAVRNLLKAPFTTLLNVVVIGIVLCLPLTLYTALLNLEQLAGKLPEQNQITVYLKTSSNNTDLANLQRKYGQAAGVARIEAIPRLKAVEHMQQQGLGEVLAALPDNPLPDALQITPATADSAVLDKLVAQLKTEPTVEQLRFDAEWARRLESVLQFGSNIALLLSIALGTALVVVTGNAIRMQVLQRREEVEITKLIGGTNQFIRRPFIYFGLIQGLLGGLCACALLALVVYQLGPAVNDLAHSYGSNFTVHLPAIAALLGAIALTGALCWLGSLLAVNRFLGQLKTR